MLCAFIPGGPIIFFLESNVSHPSLDLHYRKQLIFSFEKYMAHVVHAAQLVPRVGDHTHQDLCVCRRERESLVGETMYKIVRPTM